MRQLPFHPWNRAALRGLSMAFFIAATATTHAAVVTLTFDNVNKPIPDGQSSGVPDLQTVSIPYTSIVDVNVTLNIAGSGSGAFNGDFYVQLTHSTGRSVLINRPGRTSESSIGYPDNGLSITLDDQAANDIHLYRDTTIPQPGAPLTGTWQPDARGGLVDGDPSVVTDTSERNSFLSVFNGMDPNGDWVLQVADIEFGSTGTLVSWGLEITAVPEPAHAMAVAGLLGGAAVFLRWRRRGGV